MNGRLRSAFAAVALSLFALTACAGPSSPGTGTGAAGAPVTETSAAPTESESPAETESGAAGETELMVADSELGEIIVDSKGMSLYYFTKDEKDSGKSNCKEDCLVKWPPLLTESDAPTADEAITAEIGTIDTEDGKKQVTVDGMPVYYWFQDKEPGDVLGQDVGQVWYVIAPDGEMITEKAK